MSKYANEASLTERRLVLKAISVTPLLAAMTEAAIADEPAPPEATFVRRAFEEHQVDIG